MTNNLTIIVDSRSPATHTRFVASIVSGISLEEQSGHIPRRDPAKAHKQDNRLLCGATEISIRPMSHQSQEHTPCIYFRSHASAIDLRTSSIPNGGLMFAEVKIAGRHIGAASAICIRILAISAEGMASTLVITACNESEPLHLSLRDSSIASSTWLIPCFALKRM